MNQAVKSVVQNVSKDSEDYSIIQSLCSDPVDTNVTNSKEGKWSAFRRVVVMVSQSCEDMLIKCIYGGFTYNCSDIFLTVLTDEGLCCTFNAVHRKYVAQAKYMSAILNKFSIVITST